MGTVSGLGDEALLGFIAALTLLLFASLLTVIRQPPWIPPPVQEARSPAPEPEPVDRWSAYQGPSYGRHAAGPANEPGAAPLPVRQPGQSGWQRPLAGGPVGSPAGPNGGPAPRVTGGPPWGPAPRPPGALP